MSTATDKPRLVYFQFTYGDNVTEFQLLHRNDHIKCLSLFFNVINVDHDCDYNEICDIYEPDITVFESGSEIQDSHRLNIRNTHSCPHVPKIGFLNADGFSQNRSGFLSDMDHWGIDTYFSISVCTGEHTPALSDKFFVWPNAVDPERFCDYKQEKVIPVIISGNQSPLYPWRRKVYERIVSHYPTFLCRHAGYNGKSAAARMLYGEKYARALNASLVSPTCGSVIKDVVRKHFEIPGSRTCLVTERSPALEAAGFVDMENCVFADEYSIVDKLDYLFNNENALKYITDNGYDLVHERHTLQQRDQIYQWYILNNSLAPGSRIAQPSPFEPLTAVPDLSNVKTPCIVSKNLLLSCFYRAEKAFSSGNYSDAESLYLECLSYASMFPEAKFRIVMCKLYEGEPKKALSWIIESIRHTLVRYSAVDPDPIEWAYLIICLLCLGRVRQAKGRAKQFPWMRHPELECARVAAWFLAGEGILQQARGSEQGSYRRSIHIMRGGTFSELIERMCALLERCGQKKLARRLKELPRERGYGAWEDWQFENRDPSKVQFSEAAWSGHERGMYRGSRPTLQGWDNPDISGALRRRAMELVDEVTASVRKWYRSAAGSKLARGCQVHLKLRSVPATGIGGSPQADGIGVGEPVRRRPWGCRARSG